MTSRTCLLAGAIVSLTAVLAGTFGAHGLPKTLPAEQREWFEIGVRYHMYHGLALIALAGVFDRFGGGLLQWAVWSFVGGVVFFAGSLYVMALTGLRVLGAITPIGGIGFLTGWIIILIVACRRPAGEP